MFHLPPLSTLFPYTTLFRSLAFRIESWGGQYLFRLAVVEEDVALALAADALGDESDVAAVAAERGSLLVGRRIEARSEEHTSELQSLRHLVCRLLLEKKKST